MLFQKQGWVANREPRIGVPQLAGHSPASTGRTAGDLRTGLPRWAFAFLLVGQRRVADDNNNPL
jgi:hypothetical protein